MPATEETPKQGTMVKVALWLRSEVGPGAVFTKQDLRSKFPKVQQVDRRMRDLRDYGWVIDTNKEDASLLPSELRFVREGQPVWDPKIRRKTTGVSAASRRRLLAHADFMCQICGISGGLEFPDQPNKVAVLSITSSNSGRGNALVTCQLCRGIGSDEDVIPAIRLRYEAILRTLPTSELERLRSALADQVAPRPFETALALGARLKAMGELELGCSLAWTTP